MTITAQFYEIGGCVRDRLMGVKPHDIDYTVVMDGESDLTEAFDKLEAYLREQGANIFQVRPEFLTIRAQMPGRTRPNVFDYVLAREEGPYSDGRRPDWVRPGTLHDDQKRRDFTVNSIARAEDGTLIDPFDGQADLALRLLSCVGSAYDRLTQDSLRALRAIRFCITKGFFMDRDLQDALKSEWLPPLLANVSTSRKREELDKAFAKDTVATLDLLHAQGPRFVKALFLNGLWLRPTQEEA